MDSDSSQDDDRRNGCRRRDWENRQNSDVSDDENFSRGAKSIDSPPESPPRGGGNLDSPPASPAQGVESPHSVYSGSRSGGSSGEGTPDYPQSPDSPAPKSPASSERGDRGSSQHTERGDSGSPVEVSQAQSRDNSLSPQKDGSVGSDRGNSREESVSPQRGNRHPTTGLSSHRGSKDQLVSPDNKHRRQSASQSPSGSYSSPKHKRAASPQGMDSPGNNQHLSRSPDMIDSCSPVRDIDGDIPSPASEPASPDNCSNVYKQTENSQDWLGTPPMADETCDRANRAESPSSQGSSSPVAKKFKHELIDSNTRNKSRSGRFNAADSHSPNIRNHNRKKSPINRGDISSPESRIKQSRARKDVSIRNKHSSRHKRKSPNYRRSPKHHSDSDGRSNISSDSSIGSLASHKSRSPEPKRGSKVEIKSHGEDLSDVSDIESIISASDEQEDKVKEVKKSEKEKEEKEKKNGINIEEAEQLDFEAEESDSPSKRKDNKDIDGDSEEGEVKELEEGELSDEGEVRPEETEPRPVCRFFSRGQCTWGSSCSFRHPEALLLTIRPRFPRPYLSVRSRGHHFPFRAFNPRFVHPGVTDKGNYTMFDMVRPLVPMNAGPPLPHIFPPIECYRPPMERPPMMGPPPFQQPILRREEPPGESAWERGLRQAKEMLRRSTKRKETDVDFEEKKMTLGISGQEEYDKENDYFPRPSSPAYEDYHERSKEGEKRYRSVSDRFGDYPPPSGYYRDGYYDDRSSRYHHSSRHHSSGKEESEHVTKNSEAKLHKGQSGYGGRSVPEDYYESRKKKYSSREVVVQRGEKGSWKEGGSPGSVRSRSGRGDEWSDPWMRSKSPSRKSASRKKSYSSRSRSSSYSSSSSRSSSSYSSYSHSRSQSSISRSSSRSRSRSSFSRKKLSPLSRRAKSPFSRERRVGETDRGLHMNPPPPSPKGATSPRRNPTPPPQPDRASRNISARILAAAMRERSLSSRSSSGSESSGSSSDSSSDSGSSSSSSSEARRKHSRKKVELDEKLAQAVKAKAMDALKLSGQKQQIKLTLKGPGSSISERLAAPLPRKRPAPESPNSGDDSSPNVSKKKGAPSRREELLKQLKAVEDAIARKRSKI